MSTKAEINWGIKKFTSNQQREAMLAEIFYEDYGINIDKEALKESVEHIRNNCHKLCKKY